MLSELVGSGVGTHPVCLSAKTTPFPVLSQRPALLPGTSWWAPDLASRMPSFPHPQPRMAFPCDSPILQSWTGMILRAPELTVAEGKPGPASQLCHLEGLNLSVPRNSFFVSEVS